MAMIACPHCERPGISIKRKMALGPALPATCQSCGRAIGVPWSSLLASVPFLLGMIVFAFTDNRAIGIIAALSGAVAMCFVHWKYVPLEKR